MSMLFNDTVKSVNVGITAVNTLPLLRSIHSYLNIIKEGKKLSNQRLVLINGKLYRFVLIRIKVGN